MAGKLKIFLKRPPPPGVDFDFHFPLQHPEGANVVIHSLSHMYYIFNLLPLLYKQKIGNSNKELPINPRSSHNNRITCHILIYF